MSEQIVAHDPTAEALRAFELQHIAAGIDPSGRLLVSANIRDMWVREGNDVRAAPAALTVFHIGGDGKLSFARKYDIESAGKLQWWAGMMGLPG